MTRRTRGWSAAVAALVAAVVCPALAQNPASRAHEDSQRDGWQKTEEIFKAMDLHPGSVVADIGAGGGFFTARLSRAVTEQGRVYAVDVAADALRRLRERISREGLANVEVIEGSVDDPKLPAGQLDAALIVNAYHEMKEHQAMLAKIREALKPGGRLVIVEPISPSRRGRTRAEQTATHEIAAESVQQDARDAGFRVVRLEDPFTTRPGGRDEEWLMVLTPAPPAAEPPATPPADTKLDDWQAPELRVTVEEFKQLLARNAAVVLDVRDSDSYRRGHIPGARLISPEEIEAGAPTLRQERRAIITYCS